MIPENYILLKIIKNNWEHCDVSSCSKLGSTTSSHSLMTRNFLRVKISEKRIHVSCSIKFFPPLLSLSPMTWHFSTNASELTFYILWSQNEIPGHGSGIGNCISFPILAENSGFKIFFFFKKSTRINFAYCDSVRAGENRAIQNFCRFTTRTT